MSAALMLSILPSRAPVAQSVVMSTSSKPAAKAAISAAARARRNAAARRRRAEDAADYAEAVLVSARIAAGKERVYTSEEAKRELGL